MNNYRTLILVLITCCFFACKDKPAIIQPIMEDATSNGWAIESPETDDHKVVVEDFLHTSKYTYLHVTENGETFWIAVPRSEVEKGATYYYKGGVKMQNFKSKEHDRVFETLYLVAGVSKNPISGNQAMPANTSPSGTMVFSSDGITPVDGGIDLKTLFSNPEKYSGKTIIVKGQCVKVNLQIMDRNWIHIQDGGKKEDGEYFDLTITTDENISVGSVVTMQGTIALNKDFGAGYKYNVIMENAKIY
jgi:hypothetical protein